MCQIHIGVTVFTVINLSVLNSVLASSYEEILTDYLISQPNLWLQPNPYPNSCQNPLSVNLTYNVIQVVKLSHSDETLIISGWFTIRWVDYRLKWRPSDFGDLQSLLLSRNVQLWKPDLAFGNRKKQGSFHLSASDNSSRLQVESNGYVTWLHGTVLELSCPVDMAKLPFDKQKCYLVLTTSYSSLKQLIIHPKIDQLSIDNSFIPNANHSEWIIDEIDYHSSVYLRQTNSKYQYIVISFTLKHEPLYFITFVVAPFTLISILTCSIFTLSCPSDRLVTALSLFFGATVYVIIVSSNTPRSISEIPLLGVYLLNQLGFMGFATIVAVLNSHCAQINNRLECLKIPFEKCFSTERHMIKVLKELKMKKSSCSDCHSYADHYCQRQRQQHKVTDLYNNCELKHNTDLPLSSYENKSYRYYLPSQKEVLVVTHFICLCVQQNICFMK
uniref:Neurotransmitter-gated ion-channel ligand-binding domain-containing protein n=1 Tax=Trichobilharzia regenti TaxID=157069 RepID=A0AA85KB14_TRIRE|nr:unnamed protein product [Trichobilharzia regenti]